MHLLCQVERKWVDPSLIWTTSLISAPIGRPWKVMPPPLIWIYWVMALPFTTCQWSIVLLCAEIVHQLSWASTTALSTHKMVKKRCTLCCVALWDSSFGVGQTYTLVDLFYFDEASDAPKASRLLSVKYPHTVCLHGSEHVVSLFFSDLATMRPFKVSLLCSFWVPDIHY